MQKMGLRALIRAKKCTRYAPGVSDLHVPNVLKRDFFAKAPNEKWATDITEFNVNGHKLYPSLWAAVESIAPKIGCVPQTPLEWVKREEVDGGQRDGLTTSERERIKALEREVKELRRANDILKTASAFFAQAELDRRLKS